MIRGNLIASIAVFTNLYNAEHDIYSVLARFVTATINQKDMWSFDITTLRNRLKECFEIDVYESVLKTVIRNRLKDSITNANGEYHAEPSAEALKDFNRQLSEQDTKYRPVFDALIAYYRESTTQPANDEDIIEGFTKFLLTDSSLDAGHIFSRFMLSKESDKEFVGCLNEIKEGFIIISGLKDITESTDLSTIGSWTTYLTIYLDTEELFSAYGYNGDLHRRILNDFLTLVREANKRKEYIKLKYLDETKKVIDGYFKQAERIINKLDRPDGKPAMNTILSRCHDRGEVMEERGKFYAFLQDSDIEYDERSVYIDDMNGNLQTTENLDAIQTDAASSSLTISEEDVAKYLRIFSIISGKRRSMHKSSFEQCQCVLLSESSIPKFISRHASIRQGSDFTYSATMDYAISRLWFRLHKGIMKNQTPASLDVMNRVKLVMSSLLHHSVVDKYDELRTKSYDDNTHIHIYNGIRVYEIHPEDITNANIDDVVGFIEIRDVETLRREKAELQERANRGDAAIKELKERDRKLWQDVKDKVRWKVRNCMKGFCLLCALICGGLGFGIYYAVSLICSSNDTMLSVLSFVIGCIVLPILGSIPSIRKKIAPLRNRIIRRKIKSLYLKSMQKK